MHVSAMTAFNLIFIIVMSFLWAFDQAVYRIPTNGRLLPLIERCGLSLLCRVLSFHCLQSAFCQGVDLFFG
jgi:hypothetical protein